MYCRSNCERRSSGRRYDEGWEGGYRKTGVADVSIDAVAVAVAAAAAVVARHLLGILSYWHTHCAQRDRGTGEK